MTEFCQFGLPGQSYASPPFVFCLCRSLQPRSLHLPSRKTLCQPPREQLSPCSMAPSIFPISLFFSQQASNNSQLPFCLSLPSARPFGRFSQLPALRSSRETSALCSAGWERGGESFKGSEGSWEDKQRRDMRCGGGMQYGSVPQTNSKESCSRCG